MPKKDITRGRIVERVMALFQSSDSFDVGVVKLLFVKNSMISKKVKTRSDGPPIGIVNSWEREVYRGRRGEDEWDSCHIL